MDVFNEYKTVVKHLFNEPYSCVISVENLALLFGDGGVRSLSEGLPTYLPNPDINMPGVTVSYSNPMEAGILALLNNGPSFTRDMEEESDQFNIVGPSESRLTTAHIAELMYLNGEVSLCNPMDADVIYQNIDKYLALIDERAAREPHFHFPPADDIEAFKKLKRILEPIAMVYRRLGAGNSTISELFRIMGGDSATGILNEIYQSDGNKTLRLDGMLGAVAVGNQIINGASPYAFR